MIQHAFVPDPHGRGICDARVEGQDGRGEMCGRKLVEHVPTETFLEARAKVDEVLDKANTEPGAKFDVDKPRWDLLPWGEVFDVVRVLDHGARKYGDDNWQKVPRARRRYFAAAVRHLVAWWGGERLDPESGLPHLAHASCCLLFLAWGEKEREV